VSGLVGDASGLAGAPRDCLAESPDFRGQPICQPAAADFREASICPAGAARVFLSQAFLSRACFQMDFEPRRELPSKPRRRRPTANSARSPKSATLALWNSFCHECRPESISSPRGAKSVLYYALSTSVYRAIGGKRGAPGKHFRPQDARDR